MYVMSTDRIMASAATVLAKGKFPLGYTSNMYDLEASGGSKYNSGRSPRNNRHVSSMPAPEVFSNREVDEFHDQGEIAMHDLLEYNGAASYHKISDKDKCILYECLSSSATTTTVVDETYSVKGVVTVCTHLSEVMELLSANSQYFSRVLAKLLGPIHAESTPIFPQDEHDPDEHALLVTYLALQSSSTAAMNNDLASANQFRAKATSAQNITREYCFLRYCGYFNNNNEAGRMERVLPSEPLRPESKAVSIWDSIANVPIAIAHHVGPMGRLVKTGFILEQAKAPNAVRVNFIMSMHPHGFTYPRQVATEKLMLQRMVRTILLNVSAAVMELRLLKDHLLGKSSWTDSPMCTVCLKNFSLLRRKHHCRLCGDAFCTTCSLSRPRPDLGDSVRVCHACVEGNISSLVRSSEKLFSAAQPSHLYRHSSLHSGGSLKGRSSTAGKKAISGWSLSARGRSPKAAAIPQPIPPSDAFMSNGTMQFDDMPPSKKAPQLQRQQTPQQQHHHHHHPMELPTEAGRRPKPSVTTIPPPTNQKDRKKPKSVQNPLHHHQYSPEQYEHFRPDGPRSVPFQQQSAAEANSNVYRNGDYRGPPANHPRSLHGGQSPKQGQHTPIDLDGDRTEESSPRGRRSRPGSGQAHSPPQGVFNDVENAQPTARQPRPYQTPTVAYGGQVQAPTQHRGFQSAPAAPSSGMPFPSGNGPRRSDQPVDSRRVLGVPEPVVLDKETHPELDFDLRHHHPFAPNRTTSFDHVLDEPNAFCGQYLYQSTPFTYPLNFHNGNPWPDAPMTAFEEVRMERARDLDLLRRRDDILMYVRIAAKTMNCPVATLCIVGGQAGLLIAKVGGVTTDTIPRQVMLESHAILSRDPTVVLDCLHDLRFATNPLVCEGDIGIRFYVGMPLCTSDGLILGVLSVVDTLPRDRVRVSELDSLRQVTDTIMRRFEHLATGARWEQDAFQRQCELDLELD
ncbi:hypothetical protein H310_04479 [Aphanomyces invadans]|uniref:FYVE-type domain-containing protein n=1 Tax=Aphanomyces invadans TaxID=157072 RepID=A0A024UCX5_9STRA|nr:hypothetical protein H310_04479 [Aphanomyces invadans]ETW04119.1 hypothetical protein H310_04479 [Aphanomyces invadans]|eukprot:XP_008867075.1 hypothetical protein H310_04479 [Aphanomyces invadans]